LAEIAGAIGLVLTRKNHRGEEDIMSYQGTAPKTRGEGSASKMANVDKKRERQSSCGELARRRSGKRQGTQMGKIRNNERAGSREGAATITSEVES